MRRRNIHFNASRWFDGIDDRVIGTNPLIGNTPFTLCADLRFERSTGTLQIAVQAGNSAVGESYWLGINRAGGKDYIGGGRYAVTNINVSWPVLFGRWHRVVLTHPGGFSACRLYVDGVLGGVTGLSTPAFVGALATIGKSTGGGYAFAGNACNVRIDNREWTAAEIEADVNGEVVNEANIVRSWRLDELTGDTAFESVGATHDTVIGALPSKFVPGVQNRLDRHARASRWFDGIDDQVQGVGEPLTGNEAATVVAWLRADKTVGTYELAVCTGTPGSYRAYWIGAITSGGRQYYGGGVYGVANLCAFDVNSIPGVGWHRVVIRKGVGVAKPELWVDGNLKAIAPASYTMLCDGAPVIGRGTAGTLPFPGNIYDVRIYSRALTDSEIKADYLGHAIDPTNLERHWLLDEMRGDTARELVNGTDDVVTGALRSGIVPFRRRRIVADIPYCVAVDGMSYVDVPHHTLIDPESESFDFLTWVKHDQIPPPTDQYGFHKYAGNIGFALIWDNPGAVWQAYLRDSVPVAVSLYSGVVPVRNEWYPMRLTVDRANGEVRLQVGFAPPVIGSLGALGSLSQPATSLFFGRFAGGFVGAFEGALWRKGGVWSDEEVDGYLYDQVVPPNTTCHWLMTEAAGADVFETLNGRNGTLTGGSRSTMTRCKARSLIASPRLIA